MPSRRFRDVLSRRIVWLAHLLVLSAPAALPAQSRGDSTPSTAYFTLFGPYYAGEYNDALRGFAAESRGSIKGVGGRWIDAICYHTMTGECYYQMGSHTKALEEYTAGLQLFLKHNDWLLRVSPTPIKPSNQVANCPWGRSSRTARIGDVPESMMMSQGNLNNNNVAKQGGVVQPATLFPIQATEIVRMTSLALRRRRELLGPTGPYDPLNTEITAALSRRPITPNDWKEAWIDVELGLAYAAVGNDGQAKGLFQRGMVAGGEFDHPLTGVALFELGRICFTQGDYDAAAKFLEEASYSAYQYGDAQLAEEALRYGHLVHLLRNAKGPYPPLEAAAGWARQKRLVSLQASFTLSAAEGLANLGRSGEAVDLLNATRTTMGNRDMSKGKLGARLHYLTALAMYQQGKTKSGDEALASALAFQRGGGSLWLHYIGLVDRLHTAGTVSDRVAMGLYDNVLRDPQAADWNTDPLEALSVLTTLHSLPYEHWFETALDRKEHERALEISDLLRRHRFLSALPMGGRVLQLEWLLEAPEDSLDQQARLQRQDLLNRHPLYSELAGQVRALKAELEQMPLVAQDAAQHKQQSDKLARIADLSAKQEVLLREVAVRREPCSIVFPPQRSIKDVQKALGENHALLAYFATSKQLYACLINNDNYPSWEVGGMLALKKQTETMLRGMGNFESNHVAPLAELRSNAWSAPAQQVRDALFKGTKAQFPGKIEELVIVPDSFLWYLPFEALPIGDKGSQPLITQTRVRYVPTISLAIPDSRGRKTSGNTAVVLGKLYPQASDSVTQTAFNELSQTVRGASALRSPLPAASSVYGALFDRLVVLDDVVPGDASPLGWSPVTLDKQSAGSTLESWMGLPWGGPDQVLLPAFHTPAENSLKKLSNSQAGLDLFYASCALMASGTRTALVGRWRTGGQTSLDLTREFLQELPHSPAAAAWQRSVVLAQGAPVLVEQEPRIKASSNDEPPTAGHPFFWAGYLLLDTGAPPFKSDDTPQKIELKPGAAAKAAEIKQQAPDAKLK